MAAGPSVEVRGLDRLLRKLSPALIAGPVANLVNRLGIFVQGEARIGAKPHAGDTGELARSIRTEVASARMPLAAMAAKVAPSTGPTKKYAWPAEKGRLPGRQPPTAPIADWLRRHGSDPALAFVVARAIGRRGTKGLHYMENALEAGRGKTGEFVGGTLREIEAAWRGR